MTDELEIPAPKKKGWPKGKKRGPRKPVEPPVASTPPPAPVAPPSPAQVPNPGLPASTYIEPVEVGGTLTSGKEFRFRCAAFNRENGGYTFVSYPPMRGFKTVTLLKAADISAIQITAPEQMLEVLRQASPAPTVAPVAYATPVVPQTTGSLNSGPVVYGNPIAAAIRQEHANVGERVAHPALPMSKTVDENGREAIVGATMLGAPIPPK